MMIHNEYLTEEELEQLISEVEASDLVPAPPELKDNILNAVFGQMHAEDEKNKKESVQEIEDVPNPPPENIKTFDERKSEEIKKRKQREFAGYCFRVGMSVAAAVAFIFIMPYLPEFHEFGNELLDSETIKEELNLPERPEWEMEQIRNYPTREEVLNDTNIIQKVFGENGIFTNNNDFNIFTEKDGGQ